MAEERDDIILDLSVDQGDLVKQLNQAKKAIIETREEQAKLRKEYTKGAVTIDEYAEESVKLEKQLKDENDSYKNLTKAIQANSSSLEGQRAKLAVLTRERNKLDKSNKDTAKEFDRLTKEIKDLNDEIGKHEQAGGDFRRNVGNYKNAIVEASNEINVGGQSVAGLSDQMAKFVNPVTAAVAGVGALVGMYTKSTTGANDLAFAQSRLNNIFSQFSELIGSTFGDGRQGQGLFSKLLDGVLKGLQSIAPGFAGIISQSEIVAEQLDRLIDLEIELVRSRGLSKLNEQEAELQRRIRDDEEQSLEKRLKASEDIVSFLEAAGAGVIEILKDQVEVIKATTVNYNNNREAQLQVAQIEQEIFDKQEEITGKLTENVMARRAILALIKEQAEFERQEALTRGRSDTTPTFTEQRTVEGIEQTVDVRPEGSVLVDQARIDAELQISIQKKLNRDILKLRENQYIEDVKRKRAAEEQKRALDEQSLALTADILAQGATLFEEQSAENRVLSGITALIKTYEAANVALASAPPPANFFLAALTTAVGLTNAAKISGFEGGGYTGPGHNTQPAGIVHKNEVVWNAQDVAAVGGPSVANMMRPTHRSRNSRGRGYQDGGIVAAAATRETNQQLITANLLKNMPAPEVSAREFIRVMRRVQVKENITRS